MISLPFRRLRADPRIDALYGMIVAQARSATFYRDYGVPDTVDGRLDMIVLHLMLVLRRLSEGGTMPPVGQELFDRFCQDIDDNFREMGVGDLTVPKKMRQVAEIYYGRAKAYETALRDADPKALETNVARNVFGIPEAAVGARRLAAYMRQAARQLETQQPDRQQLEFPDPEAQRAADSTHG